jgi:hypothetical protein
LATAAAVVWGTLQASAQAQGGDIVIFAAASLKDALDAINAEWQKEIGKKATISYAASSVLGKQIEQDAPVQIFISADLDWMDYVEQKKLIKPESRVNLLGNRIVLIARKDKAQPIDGALTWPSSSVVVISPWPMLIAFRPASTLRRHSRSSTSGRALPTSSRNLRTCALPCCVSRAARRLSASSIKPMPPPIRT